MGKASTYSAVEGVVLAGGLNSRFKGEVKAKMVIDKRPIIANTLSLLEKIFERVSIVANDPVIFSDYHDYPIVGDIFEKIGPLGGIHSALSNALKKTVFVVACDMPLLDEGLMRAMVENYISSDYEVLIPTQDGYNEPLHAIYSVKVLERLEQFLSSAKNYAIKDFLGLCNYGLFPVKQNKAFTNINTPADLERIRKDYK